MSEPRDRNDPLAGFSIAEYKFARLTTQARELAMRECCDLLESRVKANATPDSEFDIQVAYAAQLLGELRPTDQQFLGALCKNVTLHPEFVVGSGTRRPLTPYPVARALAEIGGREAAEGILRHMKNKLDRKELLICAHVLYLCDDHPIIFERMNIARKRAEAEASSEENRIFFENLAKVKTWLEDPRFLTDEEFRP